MLSEIILLFVAFLSVGSCQNVESRVVSLAQGPVRGYRASNSEVFQFFGIPYATAPTGVNKFKAPEAAPEWVEEFEAVESHIFCPHFNLDIDGMFGREDCLVAHVHQPNTQETNLPVLVYIHGGGYSGGFAALGSPRPLVESQKIVAVTFNYRLGAHGFICLGTEDIPGNAGLKDMVAALRWVRDNIASFGGNPDDVTVAGYSAGASAVEHLSLSKAANGLFHKVIIESGAATAWGVQKDPIKTIQDHARRLNFTNVGNLIALEEFYKSLPYDVLLSDTSAAANYNSDMQFVPCIEKDLGQERILDDSPVNVIKNSDYTQLPLLHGFTNMEGRLRMPQFDEWAPKMNEKFSDFLQNELEFENDDEKEAVAHTVKEFYFNNNPVGLYTLFNYIDYHGDIMFSYPMLRSLKLRAEAGEEQIYLYEYTFYKKFNPVPGVPDVLVNFPGADHSDQTIAVLDMVDAMAGNEENYSDEYLQNRAQMRELWLNFITTGMPVPADSSFPSWPPANASGAPYMILGDTFELGGALRPDAVQLWDDIYERYYRDPIPPVFEESEDIDEDEDSSSDEDEDDAPDSAGSVSANIAGLIVVYMIRVIWC